ncbi:MAG: DUF72 domain-containing protein [Chloroflexi bacterium]|nr:DUF72 domain-containing protein [Chloroflexota bacterium]
MTNTVRYWVGTSGWMYRHWRGRFYPEDLPPTRWLEYYTGRFSSLELNAPFYRLPTEAAIAGWRERAPAGFRYAVKASRLITHAQRLKGYDDALATFLASARLLGDRLGPVLFQLPPDLARNDPLLADFLALLPRDLRYAIEFRSRSWFDDTVFDLLRTHHVALCVHDWRQMVCPRITTTDFAYYRFHGPTGYYGGRYGEAALRRWADALRGGEAGVQDVYAYFNNDAHADAIEDAQTLQRLLMDTAGEHHDVG